MLIPVRCVNCGKLLADKYNHYLAELKMEKGVGFMEPTLFDGKTMIQTKEGKIFKKLKLNRYCCRKTVLTHVDLIEKI
jgi:DNA-directed RNA polymerase I, II, and III subunit RPABC5